MSFRNEWSFLVFEFGSLANQVKPYLIVYPDQSHWTSSYVLRFHTLIQTNQHTTTRSKYLAIFLLDCITLKATKSNEKWHTHNIFRSKFHHSYKNNPFHTLTDIHMVYTAGKIGSFHQQSFSILMDGQQTSKNI